MARKAVSTITTPKSLAEIEAEAHDVDLAMLDATTDADRERHKLEDGEAQLTGAKARLVVPPAIVRKRLGLSQSAFAALLDVPLGTLKNWEQGRVPPDPAARALLAILYREPKAAMRALQAAALPPA